MIDSELKKCVAHFEQSHPICRNKDVFLNIKADQYTQGFKLLPTLTDEWRRYRLNWERRLRGEAPVAAGITTVRTRVATIEECDIITLRNTLTSVHAGEHSQDQVTEAIRILDDLITE